MLPYSSCRSSIIYLKHGYCHHHDYDYHFYYCCYYHDQYYGLEGCTDLPRLRVSNRFKLPELRRDGLRCLDLTGLSAWEMSLVHKKGSLVIDPSSPSSTHALIVPKSLVGGLAELSGVMGPVEGLYADTKCTY